MELFRKVNRVALLVRCIGRAVASGAANKLPASIPRIIIAPSGKLGDVVCTTPVLHAIRVYLPGTRIIVAGNSNLHRSLLSDSGLVDEYLDLGTASAIGRLRSVHAQVAIATGPSYESVARLCVAGIPMVIAPEVRGGFSPANTRPYRILRRFIATFPYNIESYAPRERLKSLELLGIISDDTKKHLGFSQKADEATDKLFSDYSITRGDDFVVGISPSAGNRIKEWPEERFAEVAQYLITHHKVKVVVIGGRSEKKKVERVVVGVKSKGDIFQTTALDIDELKALVSKLNMFIAVDTGPIYIAEAFDVPTIDIVGPVDERVQPPRGFIHRNVVPPNRARPELSILNARSFNHEEARSQILSIDVPAVVKEVDRLIEDLGGRSGML